MHKSIANTVCALCEDCRESIKCLREQKAGGGKGGAGEGGGSTKTCLTSPEEKR